MDLRDYVGALRRRWYLLLALTVLGAFVGLAIAAIQAPQYRASASAFVSTQRGATTSELVQGSQFTQSQMQSYANLVKTPAVLDPVIRELGLNTTPGSLAERVESDVELNTVIISITVTGKDPETTAETANAIVESLADIVAELAPRDADGDPSVSLTTVSPSGVPTFPSAPNKRLLVLSGALIGLIAAALYAVLKGAFDTRLRDESDLERVADVPFLGSAPRRARQSSRAPRQPAVTVWEQSASTREAYRRVATNLEFAGVDGGLRDVVVTSALPGEGKTTTSAFLALALAERGHRVLAIDGDLRHPHLAEAFGLPDDLGLTAVLRQQVHLSEAVQPLPGRSVDVLASGTRAPNPAEIVNSRALRSLLSDAREGYDFVVIDSAPVLAVSDTLTIARMVGSAVVVTRFNSTRRQSVAQAIEELLATGAKVHGVVLNAVHASKRALGYYGEDGALSTSGGSVDADLAPGEASAPETAGTSRRSHRAE